MYLAHDDVQHVMIFSIFFICYAVMLLFNMLPDWKQLQREERRDKREERKRERVMQTGGFDTCVPPQFAYKYLT